MVVAETERLILRHFRMADVQAMHRVFGDPEVMRFGDGVKTVQWVREWLGSCIREYRDQVRFGSYAIVPQAAAEPIGYCGLFYYPDVCGQPETEIGYRLARPYWGCGYATEAALALRNRVFDALGMLRLIAMIDPLNVASIRVAEKIGMRYEKDVILEGYDHPDRVYAIN